MSQVETFVVDGNEAAAHVAYRTNEVIAIYPITPSSPMGEHADAWAARRIPNIWGTVPHVAELQSEGGAAGAIHGALQGGALATTFTASQGLLLMLPNMLKIAGELTPAVFHIAARSIATHALSIFCDHSDVYAVRPAGWGMLFGNCVQEAHDFALITQAASLQSRLPFLNIFDGFRTSHELEKIQRISDADIAALIDDECVRAHRARSLSPDHPVVRGTAQNPDIFFQAREASAPFYAAAPEIVQAAMDAFADRVGRRYHLFDYAGHPEAERVVVLMGSGAETVEETARWMADRGERVGVVKVHLYRPFSIAHFARALPETVQSIAVLDRTKEPGATGDPLYLDVVAALHEVQGGDAPRFASMPRVVGGRYGLSSKEFTPAMVRAVYDELATDRPKNHFVVGIQDDVSGSSLDFDPSFDIEADDVFRGVFFGLGADGTVGANKNSIKIIGQATDQYCQGFFVYDSKKSGAITISHLRFGPRPITSTYLIQSAAFVGVHQWEFLEQTDVLQYAAPGATLLLNAPMPRDRIWSSMPREVQQAIVDKGLEVYGIDAYAVARDNGMGRRINTVMQTAFFKLTGVIPTEEAIDRIKGAIDKTYGKKGDEIVRQNHAAVDASLAAVFEVHVPDEVTTTRGLPPVVRDAAPPFVRAVTAPMMARRGDALPVSAFTPDGTWPTATSQWEKRNIATEIPAWDGKVCIQCNKCALICPHAAIRTKVYDEGLLADAPETFKHVMFKGKEFKGDAYTVQVAPEDCTGCGLCVAFCPAKDKTNPRHKAIDMVAQRPLRDPEAANWDFFLGLPEIDRAGLTINVKTSQLLQPLFEFSGACAGCGETPYVKLVTQLFGDRMVVANATGCSSIFGGNLPTTPYSVNASGRGPAWANSLFEDNAEFGLGMRLAIDKQTEAARELVEALSPHLEPELVQELLSHTDCRDEAAVAAQRDRVELLKTALAGVDRPEVAHLLALADYLVRKSVWLIGGDGWAYDIGYGGLDHVLASGRDVNVLVLDTEVYSNTGGQASKATPIGAVAKFAANGKSVAKKDLGLLAVTYGDVYVARIAIGASDRQTLQAMMEADAYPGPSLLIAYSPCIAHGFDLKNGAAQQQLAVDSGYWPLYRFDPRRAAQGEHPFQLDSKRKGVRLEQYAYNETRYRMLLRADPDRARLLMTSAKAAVERAWNQHEQLATPPATSTDET